MNNFLPDSTGCAKDDVRSRERHTACFLIETSGLLLTHSDFLLTKEQNDFNSNVFLGTKEPDLADALINDGIIKYMNSCLIEVLQTAFGRFAELGVCEAQVYDSQTGEKVVYIKGKLVINDTKLEQIL